MRLSFLYKCGQYRYDTITILHHLLGIAHVWHMKDIYNWYEYTGDNPFLSHTMYLSSFQQTVTCQMDMIVTVYQKF